MYILCQPSNKPDDTGLNAYHILFISFTSKKPDDTAETMGGGIIQKLFTEVVGNLLTCHPNPSLISPLLTNSLFLILSFCL